MTDFEKLTNVLDELGILYTDGYYIEDNSYEKDSRWILIGDVYIDFDIEGNII